MNRLRRNLLLAGVLPGLLALAFLVKVGLMLTNDSQGRSSFDSGDHAGAADEFAANDRLNWFEPWVASFDEGAARHADGELERAVELYTEALEDVPPEEECTVRINLALAEETLGDTAATDGDPEAAVDHWQAGIDALAAGDCPAHSGRGEEQTDDAAAVDRRLRDKARQQEQQQQQQQEQKDKQKQEQQQGEQKPDPKEKKLEERNGEAIEEKQEYDDANRDRDYSEYQW